MRTALASALIIQGIAILLDEILFHHHRALPLWERIGHPLDTLTMLVCLVIPALLPFTRETLGLYTGAAILSCLWVTKDEAVHAKHCRWEEHWLHAVLFLAHPVVLIFAALCWARSPVDNPRSLLLAQILLMALFLGYQLIYWNWIWPRSKARV